MKKFKGLETTALHAGYEPIPMDPILFRSFTPPIIQSALYPFETVDQYTRISQNLEPGYHYGRTKNPTVDVLQKRLAAMEGGEQALVTASGMLAVFTLVFHLAKPGDEIVTSHKTYGEAYRLFFQLLPEHMGITARLVEKPDHLADWERQITSKTRFVWAETPSNPTLFITDIRGLAEITRARHVPLIVDNTLATACLLKPLDFGADIVVLSLTKYICGNGTTVGGAIIGEKALIGNIVSKTLGYIGATMDPMAAWHTLMNLETLPLRMAKHCTNAEKIATYLAGHPNIERVNYPSRPDHPQHELAQRQMPKGFGGLISFIVKGGRQGAVKTMESFKMIPIVPSFGTSRTIATHPATHTHPYMKPDERKKAGIADGLIRLSVGLEDTEDIIGDLEQALI
jgi:cystathionine beta-lyase/cystathionine gamma-synthase